MSKVVDLDSARWTGNKTPADHKPVEALKAAIRAIEEGHIDATHVVIGIASTSEKRTHMFQAGPFDYWGQVGLVHRLAHVVEDTRL